MTAATTLDERWHRNFEAHRQRLSLKERAIAYLGGKCQKCGYDQCPAAMDFHHLDGLDKDFDISSKTSWATIEPELKKCALLCSNCHRETHDGCHPDLLIHDEEGMGYGEDLDILGWDDDEDTKVENDPLAQWASCPTVMPVSFAPLDVVDPLDVGATALGVVRAVLPLPATLDASEYTAGFGALTGEAPGAHLDILFHQLDGLGVHQPPPTSNSSSTRTDWLRASTTAL